MLVKTTWFNWNNNSKQLLNVLRHMQGNYIAAWDTLPDTIMMRILICYLCTSPKLPQSVAMPMANPHFFVYPPERGEIGQSLPRLAYFHLRPLYDTISISAPKEKLSEFVSGQWLHSWGKEWVCDFYIQLKRLASLLWDGWTEYRLRAVPFFS